MKRKIASFLLSVTLIMSTFACLSGISVNAATALSKNQQNIVDRANYLWNSTWVCKKTVAGWGGTFYAGNTYRLPYGQPVYSGQYIGYGVSVPAFLSAAANANSIFYSGRSHCGGTTAPYYATDCSAFVSWCWSASRHTTYSIPQISTYKGMANANNNTWTLQVGDCLNSNSVGHVVLVTAINRNSSGAATQIEITEQTPPQLKRSYYTPASLASKYGAYYGIYRYNSNVAVSPGGSSSNAGFNVPADVKALIFDANFYSDSYSDLKKAFGTNEGALYNHFLNYGIKEGRTASPYFSIKWYREKNSDLKAAFGNDNRKAFEHFLKYVKSEKDRNMSPILDCRYYRTRYSDLSKMSEFSLMSHFKNNGTKEYRQGSANFDPISYCVYNPDVYKVMGLANSYYHYMRYGINETNPNRKYTNVKSNLGNDFYATITDSNSGKNLQVFYNVSTSKYPDKNSVQINTKSTSKNQLWHFVRQSNGTYKITNVGTNKVLDVYNYNRAKEHIGAYKDNSATGGNTSSQRWRIYMIGGKCVLRAECSDYVMDVAYARTANRTDVMCDKYNGGKNQLFVISKK